MLAGFGGPSHAAEVRIGDFEFSCKSGGKTVKPKFGDIPGAYFLDMPAQRDQCIETVKRKIHGCSINTGFASNTEAERYPGCEQVFAEQGKACAAFYQEEMAKCDIGGTSGETISRECPEGWDANWSCEGPVVDGKKQGNWVFRFSEGSVWEGPLVDGKQHGHWVFRYTSGDVSEGPYVDGKRHGHWVFREEGETSEGPFVDGKLHGHWVTRFATGGCLTSEWVKGETVNSGVC